MISGCVTLISKMTNQKNTYLIKSCGCSCSHHISNLSYTRMLYFLTFLVIILPGIQSIPMNEPIVKISSILIADNGPEFKDLSPKMDTYERRHLSVAPSMPNYCGSDYIYIDGLCLPKARKIYEECRNQEQCIVQDSECINGMCQCAQPYFMESRNRDRCHRIPNAALEIYKITMIFASSCLTLIILIFLACICRKSFCNRSNSSSTSPQLRNGHSSHPNAGPSASINSNLYPIREISEKPPSYDETMKEQQEQLRSANLQNETNAPPLPPPPEYQSVIKSLGPQLALPIPNLIRSTATSPGHGRSQSESLGHNNAAFQPES
ncbi:uncharacterized protein LOC141848996 [Brevipalpus obovatus]|uniref:uncharacterized protein LOC141848996 n=1 Tax=Brevipalpus obovatus TaxID=246614 RepID=UPI003D9EFC3E